MIPVSSIFIGLVALAALSDIAQRRIPNALNFTLLLSGLVFAGMGWSQSALGPIGLSRALAGVGVALAVLIFPFAWRVYQGGDVKLCMGMGAWLGVSGVLWAIGLGVIAGGVFGLMTLLNQKLLNRFDPVRREKRTPLPTIPMAVCFSAAGVWVYLSGASPWRGLF